MTTAQGAPPCDACTGEFKDDGLVTVRGLMHTISCCTEAVVAVAKRAQIQMEVPAYMRTLECRRIVGETSSRRSGWWRRRMPDSATATELVDFTSGNFLTTSAWLTGMS